MSKDDSSSKEPVKKEISDLKDKAKKIKEQGRNLTEFGQSLEDLADATWGYIESVDNTPSFAKGGVVPGGFQAFAAGGIANKPTLGLIGEGGMNEAVVPLPDGKSIPVEGGGGDTYNINITALDSKSFLDMTRRNPQAIIIPIQEGINRGDSGLRNSLKRAVS